MEPNEIVRTLRWLAKETKFLIAANTHLQAADCIERLQAEMEERERNYRIGVNAGAYTIRRLQAELEASQRQLRAAVEELNRAEQLAEEANTMLDQVRSNSNMDYADYSRLFDAIAEIVNWQADDAWRGPEQEGE